VAIALRRRYNPRVPEFRILGPLEVLAHDGTPVALGGQKQRAVLAVLLIRANEVVSAEFLVDAVWGEQPPRTVATSLQNAVAALRRALGPGVVHTQPPGYRLSADPDTIDLSRFERLVASARQLEPQERAERLREALALWRGEPLAEIAFEPFAAAEIRRLDGLRANAVADRIDADLACDRFAEVVPELEAIIAQAPFSERPCGQLMLALYHSGRQADALRVFDDLRRRLAEELGLEPSQELQEQRARILRRELPRPRRADVQTGDEHYDEVSAALLGGRLVPVLGTDVSALAEQLASRFEYPEDGRDLTRVAQFVALTKGAGPLYDELHSLLGTHATPTPVHRFFGGVLPRLLRERGQPHQLIVTTGYDLALEQALLDAGEEFDVVSYVATGRDRGRFCHRDPAGDTHVIELPNVYATELSLDRRTVVMKLHGGLGDDARGERAGFVVTEDDYIGYLSRGDVGSAVPVGLAARLRRSHFLFLGYGMREWSLRLVLDRIAGGEPLAYRSWAVLPEARPLERQFWRVRDVDLLEQSLGDYVAALGRYVGAEPEAA
jgi:DNA-binding SARP family transcriptional activator